MTSAEDYFNKANSLLIDDLPEEALKLYDQAINADSTKIEYLLKRSACHARLHRYAKALEDAETAIKLDPNNAQGYLRKGLACFSTERFVEAKEAFEKGQALDTTYPTWKTWIRKCETEIESNPPAPTPAPAPAPASAPASSSASSAPATASSSDTVPMEVARVRPNLRHEWFQTATTTVVEIFQKGVKKEDVEIDFQPDSLTVIIKLPATSSEFQHSWDLFGTIIPSESTYQILSTKIEIKMKKKDGIKWVALEKVETNAPLPTMGDVPSTTNAEEKPPSYPTSARVKKNWDAIAKSADEDPPGGKPYPDLFKSMYADGTEEERRAMVKSYVESGGTVLNMNWKEVSKGFVEAKPPTGAEEKKWMPV